MSSANANVMKFPGTNNRSDNYIAREAGSWPRIFTSADVHPFDQVKWKKVDARIIGSKGNVVFEQRDVEVPEWWNQTTIDIVADKYLRVIHGVRETSVKQMFSRVSTTIRRWAEEQNYFNSDEDAKIYEEELLYALLHQYGAFNSPVWFNLGIPDRPQAASACFILGVEDSLQDIMSFQSAELKIFRGGSGSGANLSNLRSSYEKIAAGSYTSGPLSWMQGNNAYAGAMKSAGSTRNSAKMVVMDMDHPDILETRDKRPGFIRSKSFAEKMAHDLVSIGYGLQYDDPNGAYKLVPYQNANHSVSVPDSFMQAVLDDSMWSTKERGTGKVIHNYKARELWHEVAKAAWTCGDPGVQYVDIINKYHTTPKSGKVRGSNPCFSAETKIATEFGLVTIADLYERVLDGEVKIAVHTGNGVMMRPAIVFPTGMNPLIKVSFKSGREIDVTPDHNFLLRDGTKKPAAELESGDTVDIQCSPGSFGDYDCGLPNALEWYKIAGFVMGDGWMTKCKIHSQQHAERGGKSEFDRAEIGMCFGKDDKDILAKIESFLSSEEIPYSLKRQKGSVGESPDYLRVRRINLFRAMERISCPAGSRSHTKRIQPGVFEASRYNQLAFLSGLISADGTFRISAKGHGGNIPTRELRLSSTSLGLLQDVQSVLLNLGIKSTIIQNRIKRSINNKNAFKYTTASGEVHTYSSKRSMHELFIYGHSLRKLRDDMKGIGGLLSDRKQAQLDDFLPEGHSEPIHDIWYDKVASVKDLEREELTYNMTEFTTHTIIAEGIRIPQCSEFLHQDNTACNLCAINLTKFYDGREFQQERFHQATRIFSTAQMAIVAKAYYPTSEIEKNSHRLRPIGTNYGDLGALLMNLGYGYDTDEGRAVAARMASMMTGTVYLTAAKLAARVGAFEEFEKNRDDMLRVMRMHQEADANINERWHLTRDPISDDMVQKSAEIWREVIALGEKYGYSISQSTVQAPLGCLTAGSMVATNRGLVRIEDLGDVTGPKWQDVDFMVQTDEGPRQATKFYVNGMDDIISVTTKYGHRLRGTPKHQIKIVDENGVWQWRRFDELQPGDVVPISLNQLIGDPRPVFLPALPPSLVPNFDRGVRVPERMDVGLAELAGMFAANGSSHNKGIRLAVYVSDTDVVENYSNVISRLFGKTPTLTKDGECVSICLNSTQIMAWWAAAGLAKVNSGDTLEARVPDAILATNDKRIYGAYLRGLFTGDGSISNGLPSLTNKSEPFVRDIQTMLAAVGVPTRLDVQIGGYSKKPVYRLTVTSRSFTNVFQSHVGFAASRKASKVLGSGTWSSDRVYVTQGLFDRIFPVGSEHRESAMNRYANGNLPRHLVERCESDPELRHAMSFFYDSIESTELQGRELTYDLSVPGNVTYVANGFVSHNTISFLMGMSTTGIEPAFSLVSYKTLVGGGVMKLVNTGVRESLKNLGYADDAVDSICRYVEENDCIEGAPNFKAEHLPVFDCAMAQGPSGRSLSPMAHLKMMAAIQPLITCAQSKCLVGGTIVPTDKGLIRLGSMYSGQPEDSFTDISMSVFSRKGIESATKFYHNGVKPTKKVSLSDGRVLQGTSGHRVLVAGHSRLEWKTLDELSSDDFVAIRLGPDSWGTDPTINFVPTQHVYSRRTPNFPRVLDSDLGLFLGMLTADGHLTRANYRIGLTKTHGPVLDKFRELSKKLFGMDCAVSEDQRSSAVTVSFNSKSVIEFLDSIGFTKENVPDVVLSASRDTVIAYLSGLYLDGWVSSTISISQKRHGLISDIQNVWAALGVHTYVVPRVIYGKNYYVLNVTAGYREKAAKIISFIEPHKQERSALLTDVGDKRILPFPGIRAQVCDSIRAANRINEFGHLFNKNTKHIRMASLMDLNVHPFLDTDPEVFQYHYIPVVSVEDGGDEQTYDISVPDSHSYVANGVVSHNTVNLPQSVTVEEIADIYMEGWRLGIKCIALYRDGCKASQPLATKSRSEEEKTSDDIQVASILEAASKKAIKTAVAPVVHVARREKLPNDVTGWRHKFEIDGYKGYLIVNEYPDGRPGEIFLKLGKPGSTVSGLIDGFTQLCSIAIQYGIPMEKLIVSFIDTRFEPAGMTNNRQVRFAKSLYDYLFKCLDVHYFGGKNSGLEGRLAEMASVDVHEGISREVSPSKPVITSTPTPNSARKSLDAPPCARCGSITQRSGSCFLCASCGQTTGCS